MKAAGYLFPLTWALKGLRSTLLEGSGWDGLAATAGWTLLISLILFCAAYLVVCLAERHNKKTGGFAFF